MRLKIAGVSVFCAFAITSVSAQSFTLPSDGWAPSNNWSVDYANEQCAALRSYQTGGSDIVFGLRPRPIEGSAELIIVAPGEATTIDYRNATVSFGMGDLSVPLEIKPAALTHHILYTFGLSPDQYGRLAHATQLRITTEKFAILLPVENLKDVRTVLDDCVADLLATWGLSREVQAQLTGFPKPLQKMQEYFKSADYPASALDLGNIGAVEARLAVGADGVPRDCKVVTSSGHNDLDAITCKLALDRMRFSAATTSSGQQVESPYFLHVNWGIMEDVSNMRGTQTITVAR